MIKSILDASVIEEVGIGVGVNTEMVLLCLSVVFVILMIVLIVASNKNEIHVIASIAHTEANEAKEMRLKTLYGDNVKLYKVNDIQGYVKEIYTENGAIIDADDSILSVTSDDGEIKHIKAKEPMVILDLQVVTGNYICKGDVIAAVDNVKANLV